MYGYLIKFRHYKTRFWEEPLSGDAPEQKEKYAVLLHWYDVNLMHNILNRKSITGCFHMANMTPMMWYSKKQATLETGTYSAEFLAAYTCMEHIVDQRNLFRYLGVPVHEISYVCRDNKSQVKSSTFTYAQLNKRYNILCFHFVRNMVTQGFINLKHIPSKYDLSDILRKNFGSSSLLRELN